MYVRACVRECVNINLLRTIVQLYGALPSWLSMEIMGTHDTETDSVYLVFFSVKCF